MSSCHQNDLQVTLLPASGLPMKRVLFLQLTENLAGTWTNAKMFLCHKAGWKHAILTPMLFALSRYWMQTNTNYTTDIYLVCYGGLVFLFVELSSFSIFHYTFWRKICFCESNPGFGLCLTLNADSHKLRLTCAAATDGRISVEIGNFIFFCTRQLL